MCLKLCVPHFHLMAMRSAHAPALPLGLTAHGAGHQGPPFGRKPFDLLAGDSLVGKVSRHTLEGST